MREHYRAEGRLMQPPWRIAGLLALTMACLCMAGRALTTEPAETIEGMADLCQVSATDGLLKLDSPLKQDLFPPVSLPFLNDSGATISVRVSRDASAHLTRFSLAIKKNDRGVIVTDGVDLRPRHLSIYRTIDSVDAGKRRISLAQNILPPAEINPAEPYSRLVLKVYDRSTNPPTVLETIRGQTLEELIESDPDKVENYLQPILSDLHLQTLLAPPPLMAMQVFKSNFPPDAALSAKVTAIVAQLNADWPPDRDAASAALAGLDDAGKLILLKEDRSMLAPEQLARIDAVRGNISTLTPEQIARLRNDVRFLVRCLQSPRRAIRVAALKALNEATGKSIQFDVGEDADARAGACARIKANLLPRTPDK